MMSPNVEVQCNAVGCITNLATHEDNKSKIARSGALGPLTRLAKSKDMRVQRNATGALLNMTHSGRTNILMERSVANTPQMITDSNLSTPEQSRYLSNSFSPRTWMSSTIAQRR